MLGKVEDIPEKGDVKTEPPKKKMKVQKSYKDVIEEIMEDLKKSTKNLNPMLDDDLFTSVPLVKVIVGSIKNQKDISKTILTLNGRIPLKELQHLKRVYKKEIILIPLEHLKNQSIEEYLNENAGELTNVFEKFYEKGVPSLPPKVRKQFDECNKVWPCNFHPNKYLEQLSSGNFFSDTELRLHRKYMEIAYEVANYCIGDKLTDDEDNLFKEINATVVVDPSIQSVVAVAFDNKLEHPIQHSAMLAIDNVAKTQNGGTWVASREKLESIDVIHRGIEQDLYCHLQKVFPNVKFGAKKFKSKRDISEKEMSDNVDIGPYLCTGYYVYSIKEPCIMCSMALVHARAKRVFFCHQNDEFGGLKSRAKLQTVSSLNHHFEVFTGFL